MRKEKKMELGKLFKLQNEASQSRQQSYEKFVEDKYAKVKFTDCKETDIPYRVYFNRDFSDFGETFAEALYFFSGASVDILIKTECFRKPLSYEDAAKYFLRSKKLGINSLATVKQGDGTVLVMLGLDNFGKHFSFFVQPLRLFPKELRLNFSDKEVSDWYIYLVNTLTYVNIATTSFVNIDDDEKLEAARQRLINGEISLPLEEMAFLNYESYPWDKEHIHLNVVNRTTMDENGVFGFQHSKPVKASPRVQLPVVDLDTLEDRLYDMFVFLMKTQDLVGADTETTGLNVYFAKIVSLGLTFNNKFGFYLSFRHTKPPKTVLDINSLSFIRRLARNASKGMYNVRNGQKYLGYLDTKSEKNLSQETAKNIFIKLRFMKTIWHNAKFDTSMIRTNYDLDVTAYIDTMLAHYVARPEFTDDRSTGKLKVIAPNELGIESWKIDVEKIQDEAKDLVAAYCARDCCYMFALALNLGDSLLQEATWSLFQIEMDYLPLLVDAELAGIRLDAKKLKAIEKASQDKLDTVVNKVKEMYEQSVDTYFDKYFENLTIFGKPFVKEKAYLAYMSDPSEENKNALKELMKTKFNLNSGPLKKFFFYEIQGVIPPRKCGLCGTRNFENKDYCTNEKCKNYNVPNTAPYEFTTNKGEVSFSTDSMKVIAAGTGNTLLGELEESSHVNKLLTSFCTLDVLINPLTGNIHPCYNQARTATGRLSSSRPNFCL